ncbi:MULTISPECIES: YdeI/OmpD-associated family protein [unclassified Modestobacter]
MRFTSTVELGGKAATGIPVPEQVLESLGAGRRPPLTVTVGGHTWRTTVGSTGGRPMLPLSAENRAAAGVGAGDEVSVEVALDTAPRTVEVPAALAEALAAEPVAQQRFDALSPSGRRRHALAVEGARTDATRTRRVASVLAELLGS